MPLHIFYTTDENQEIQISMRWNRSEQGYFMSIEKKGNDDFPLWSSLYEEPFFPKTLDNFLLLLDQCNIQLPKRMIYQVVQDSKENTVCDKERVYALFQKTGFAAWENSHGKC